MTHATAAKTLRIGMIGIGVGGAEILPAMEAMDTVDLVAGADVVPQTLERFKQRFPNARTYESAEALCRDPDVDAVWVSSPNRFHAEHAILAANHGKHVVVEKPMAISMDRAAAMVEAAEKNSVKLLAGHTMSFSSPIRAMRKIIQSGQLRRPACPQRVGVYGLDVASAHCRRAGRYAGRGHPVSPGPAPGGHRAAAGRRHAAQRARANRPVAAGAADPGLLLGVSGVRGRYPGHRDPQRLRLLPGLGDGSLGRGQTALHGRRAHRGASSAAQRHAQRG